MKCPLKNFEECIGTECVFWIAYKTSTNSKCAIPEIADALGQLIGAVRYLK